MLTMHPFGQSQSKIIAVSGNVDQSKPDSHFNSQIDSYISCILIEWLADNWISYLLADNWISYWLADNGIICMLIIFYCFTSHVYYFQVKIYNKTVIDVICRLRHRGIYLYVIDQSKGIKELQCIIIFLNSHFLCSLPEQMYIMPTLSLFSSRQAE